MRCDLSFGQQRSATSLKDHVAPFCFFLPKCLAYISHLPAEDLLHRIWRSSGVGEWDGCDAPIWVR
eukprot:94055-Prymnesium_polylepis.1